MTANRAASKFAGKVIFYFAREGLISSLLKIPETGRQHFGVAHDVIPVGANIYWNNILIDKRVPKQSLDIFPPSSSNPSDPKLELVWD